MPIMPLAENKEAIDKVLQTEDYYALLGIEETASDQLISQAFRKLSVQCHPDKNPSDHNRAEDAQKKLTNARDILLDPKEREKYNLTRNLNSATVQDREKSQPEKEAQAREKPKPEREAPAREKARERWSESRSEINQDNRAKSMREVEAYLATKKSDLFEKKYQTLDDNQKIQFLAGFPNLPPDERKKILSLQDIDSLSSLQRGFLRGRADTWLLPNVAKQAEDEGIFGKAHKISSLANFAQDDIDKELSKKVVEQRNINAAVESELKKYKDKHKHGEASVSRITSMEVIKKLTDYNSFISKGDFIKSLREEQEKILKEHSKSNFSRFISSRLAKAIDRIIDQVEKVTAEHNKEDKSEKAHDFNEHKSPKKGR